MHGSSNGPFVSEMDKANAQSQISRCHKFPFGGTLFQHTHTLDLNLYEDGPQTIDGEMEASNINCNRILHIVFSLLYQRFFAQYFLAFSMRNPSLYRRM
jgi:hypothetical protein